MKILTFLFLLFLGGILTNSQLSLHYAALGLNLWFQKMIPSLLPFMILSGIMIRLKLTDKLSMILYPLVRPLYKVRKNVCYAMIIGFLCGFPMGAKTANDLYIQKMIDKREAEYILAFCNNIGPVYFCSFALSLLGRKLVFPYLFGMYGIPLLYGLFLRCTAYKDLPLPDTEKKKKRSGQLVCCELAGEKPSLSERLLEATDSAVHSSVKSILTLGGYMILFNLLNLLPHITMGKSAGLLSPLLEITGGLTILAEIPPFGSALIWEKTISLYSLLALTFGGFSCIAQTYSSIGDSGLSMSGYILHKIILTILSAFYYLCWFFIQSSSFLG